MKRAEKAERIRRSWTSSTRRRRSRSQHEDPFTLLVSVVLSAQCTDARVNQVTLRSSPARATPEAMARLAGRDIQRDIRLRPRAGEGANMRALSRDLVERHVGSVPDDLEALEALPGVGHKTASVVMAQAFGEPAFPVDTHIHRLAARWGLSGGRNVGDRARPEAALPARRLGPLHLQIIYFGREHCPARGHDLAACPICSWAASRAGAAPSRHPWARGARRRAPRRSAPTRRGPPAAAGPPAPAGPPAAAADDHRPRPRRHRGARPGHRDARLRDPPRPRAVLASRGRWRRRCGGRRLRPRERRRGADRAVGRWSDRRPAERRARRARGGAREPRLRRRRRRQRAPAPGAPRARSGARLRRGERRSRERRAPPVAPDARVDDGDPRRAPLPDRARRPAHGAVPRTGARRRAGLDHVVVRTPDPDRAAALYGARLGLDMRLDRSNPAWGSRLMFFRCGDLIVEIAHDLKAGVSSGPDRLWGLSWRVPDALAAQIGCARPGSTSRTRARGASRERTCSRCATERAASRH